MNNVIIINGMLIIQFVSRSGTGGGNDGKLFLIG